MDVLVEGHCNGAAIGRSYRDAPEIDGIVRIDNCAAQPGTFVKARITGADEYDLAGNRSHERCRILCWPDLKSGP